MASEAQRAFTSPFVSRSTRYGLLAVFVVAFGVYLSTAARTVTGEDAGELATAAATLGVAHPPGYPLYCLLGKLFSLLPVGEVAFRLALMSAFFGALTATALAALLLQLARSWPAALAVAFGFSFLRDVWAYSVVVEVYTLNTFLLATALLLASLWDASRSWRTLQLLAFTVGLSLTNHLTMLAAAGPLVLFVVIRGRRSVFRLKPLAVAAAAFVVGLGPYGYLPLAARSNPSINWGDPSTFDRFLDHVTRRQYADAAPATAQSFDRWVDQLGIVARHALDQGAVPLVVLGLVGFVLLAWRRASLFVLLGGTSIVALAGVLATTNTDLDFESVHAMKVFLVPAYLPLLVAAGWALHHVSARLGASRAARVAAPLAALVLVAQPFVVNRDSCDYSEHRLVADYGRRLLASVEPNAILFPSSDHNTFPILYLHHVEGLRPDVTIADAAGYVDPRIYADAPFRPYHEWKGQRSSDLREETLAWLLESSDRPLYFSQKGPLPAGSGFEMVPEGVWFRARKRNVPDVTVAYDDHRAWNRLRDLPIDADPARARPFDFTARMVLADVAFAAARYAFRCEKPDAAVALCLEGAAHAPESKEIQNNFGSLLAESGRHEAAWPLLRRALDLDPGYMTPRRNLGVSLLAAGKDTDAEAVFTELLSLRPSDPVAHRMLGDLYRRRSDWRNAAFHLEQTGRTTGDPRAFRDAGLIRLFELKDDLGHAKRLLQASLSIDPHQPEIADVERKIVAKDRPETGRPDEVDHSKHDCSKVGCTTRTAAAPTAPGAPGLGTAKAPKLPEGVTAPRGIGSFDAETGPSVTLPNPIPASPWQGAPKPRLSAPPGGPPR